MLPLVLLVIVAIVLYCYGINRLLGLPPGPPPLPVIGNMLSFKSDFDKVLLEWKAKYGRVFTVWLPYPIVVLGDHQLLQEHVVKNGDVYLYRKIPEQLMQMVSGGSYGLAFEDNSMVKEQRKFAIKALHGVGFGTATLEDAVYHEALEVVSRWKLAGEEAVDVTENICKAVGNVVWNVIFGLELEFDNEIVPRFLHSQHEVSRLLANPLMMFVEMLPFLRKLDFLFSHFNQLQSELDQSNQVVIDAIEETTKHFDPDNEPRSYVDAFLREMKKNAQAGKPEGNFHYEQMRNAAASLWSAGVDTTVSILRLCCLELVNNPHVQKRLQKEINYVIGERRIRNDDQKQLPYMCAFLQEIYRIGQVLLMNFNRLTTEDTVIEGFRIASGTTVLPQFTMVHTDPNEFERPDFFCPERYIDEEGNFIKDHRITPFSIGKRACLGEPMARMEIFVMVATFVQHCNFTPVGKVPPPVDFTYGFLCTVKHFMVKIQPSN